MLDFTQQLPPTKGGLSTRYLGTIEGQEPFRHLMLCGQPMSLNIFNTVDDAGVSNDPDREMDLAVTP